MIIHVLATNGGVGVGIGGFGDLAGEKASIVLTGRQAKGFMAALEKAMQRAGLTKGDYGALWASIALAQLLPSVQNRPDSPLGASRPPLCSRQPAS